MANPQAENGHIDIANEIAEALMRVNLSPYESRVLWFILRKTYGWKKKTDWIALSQFSKAMMLDRRLVHRALKGLASKNIIVISRDDKNHVCYGFQKNYERWKLSSKTMTVISRDDRVSSVEMTGLSSVEMTTKDTITKDTITKDTKVSSSNHNKDDISLTQMLIDLMAKNNPNSSILKRLTPKRQDEWIKTCHLLRERDGHSIEEIQKVIYFCQSDSFWKSNILSMPKLREKWDQLWLKARKGDKFDGIREWLNQKEKENEQL